MVFKNAKWIWNSFDFGENEYAEFYDKVEYNGGNVVLNISVCGDYTLFIKDGRCAFGVVTAIE